MLDTEKLRALEELHRRRDALGPNATRDAVLGWVGALVVGVLVYLYMTAGPTAAERKARDELQAQQQAARVACAAGYADVCERVQ